MVTVSSKSLALCAVLALLALAGAFPAGYREPKPPVNGLVEEGDRLFRAGDADRAMATYRRALAQAGPARAEAVRGHIHFAEGVAASRREDLDRSAGLFEQALAEARRGADRRLEGRALHARGNIALRQNEFPRARDLYQASLRIAKEIQDPAVSTLACQGLGDVAAELGRNSEALGFYQEALVQARRAANRNLVEKLLNAIGAIYLEWADYGKALQYLQEALRTGTDDRSELSYLLNNLGMVYGSQGISDLGLEYFRRALRLAEAEGDAYGRMRLLNNIGAYYESEGQYEKAREHFSLALRLAQEVDDRTAMPGHWHSLGSVYELQGRNALAGEAYRKSLELAEALGERNQVSQALAAIGHVELAEGRPRQALALADRAAATAAETGSRETFWRARTLAGRALHALERDEAAGRALAEAAATLEQVRSGVSGGELGRQAFFEGRLEPYQRMIELAADHGEAAQALAPAERAKSRVLLEILRGGRVDLASQLTPRERATEQRLRDRLAALNGEVLLSPSRTPAAALQDLQRRLQQARRELEAYDTNLYASRPGLRTRRADFPDWTPQRAAGLLAGGGTALIEYAVLPEVTYLFTVTADGDGAPPTVRLHRLPAGREALRGEVEAFRGMLAGRDLDFRRPARRLYDLLLAPAAPELRGRRTLCIVPDGPLWDLPFQALQPDGSSVLLERHAIHYAPSLSFLSELAARQVRHPSRATTLLAVGDPDPGTAVPAALTGTLGPGLARLPEAEREVRTLARLYGPGRSAVYLAALASEERVKAAAAHYRVLHFATHALLDDRNPMYSSLVLSRVRPGSGEDGLLQAWELFDLHLDADLVVLSACQTARGRPQAGEGMIGMIWALAAAGSPATLASQWEVDSASTSRLMVEFHRGWLAGLDKAEALRRAALAVRAEPGYSHPFYWAPFVLVGEGG